MSLKGMMIRKIRAIDYDKLNKLASDIGKRNNKSVRKSISISKKQFRWTSI